VHSLFSHLPASQSSSVDFRMICHMCLSCASSYHHPEGIKRAKSHGSQTAQSLSSAASLNIRLVVIMARRLMRRSATSRGGTWGDKISKLSAIPFTTSGRSAPR
jgi:hypothetical protein